MASIAKRTLQDGKTSRWGVRVRCNGHFASNTLRTRREATDWAKEKEQEFTLDRRTVDERAQIVTLERAVERYLVHLRFSKGWKQRRQQLLWWAALLGEKLPLLDVSSDRISQGKEALTLAGYSPATIRRYLSAISQLLEKARREWKWIQSNPVRDVEYPPEPDGRVRRLSVEERRNLLFRCSVSSNRQLYAIVVVALSTGARKSEIRKVRPDQVNLELGRIYLDEILKNGERRSLKLYGEALQVMERVLAELPPGAPVCFPSSRERGRPADIRYAWVRALTLERIPDFCFHDLRHSAASYLAEQGATLEQIGRILGHKTGNSTKRYIHLTEDGTSHLVEKMNHKILPRGRVCTI